jgi:uncharacterized protein YmfQ (DUF2313 family)
MELGGVFDEDIATEGAHLDAAQTNAEKLLKEMFPDQTTEGIVDWERVCGLTPSADAPLQTRREDIIRKLRERGGLSRTYFIILAAAMGYDITIDELYPFMCGWGRCADRLYTEAVRFFWRVNVSGQPLYYFRAGQSTTGERLSWWPTQTSLENIFNDLKPAHTYIVFNYS